MGRTRRRRRRARAATSIDLDIAAILYTSGSTGKPKGVVLSHRNLVVGAESVSHYLGNIADDVILAALPLSFDAGFSQLTTGFTVGAHVVLMNYLLPRRRRPPVRRARRHRAHLRAAALDPARRARTGRRRPARLLRYFANTGGRMPRTTLDRLRAIFPGARPFLMYGLTEAFRSTYLDPAEVDRRPDSIGKAIPNAEILVVRPGRLALRARRGGRAGAPRRARGARATGTTPSAPRSGSGRLPGTTRRGARRPSSRSGPATGRRRRGGLPLLRRPQRTR